jgi:hypothetical protein
VRPPAGREQLYVALFAFSNRPTPTTSAEKYLYPGDDFKYWAHEPSSRVLNR